MEYVWLAVSLLILIIVVWKPATKGVLGALDARSERIRSELDEAHRLSEEAKALLARYRQQLEDGEATARQIAARAEAERDRLDRQLRADLESLTARRTQQAVDRIAQEEQRAVDDIRASAASLAIRATRTILTERMTPDQARQVMRDAVGEVGRKLA